MFALPELPYGETALSPHMSRDTLHVHHDKHHAAYVKKTNAALEKKKWEIDRIEDVIARAKKDSDQFLFNQSAQVWNHTFFWNCMTPDYAAPPSHLLGAIEQMFGGMDEFKTRFIDKGEKHFGSGWVWLTADSAGNLNLTDGHDAATPIVEAGITPVLTCDLWEHAYYLDHQSERGAFLEVFLDKLVNWRFAGAQLAAARGENKAWEHPRAMAPATA
jgi:Fe-Mn family superoxide dismutase